MSIIKLSTVANLVYRLDVGDFLQAFEKSALLKCISSAFVGSLGVIIYLHLQMVPSFVKGSYCF